MTEWTLQKRLQPSRRLRVLHTPLEVVRPTTDGSVATVTTSKRSTRDLLCRRYGFSVVQDPEPEPEPEVDADAWGAPSTHRIVSSGLAEHSPSDGLRVVLARDRLDTALAVLRAEHDPAILAASEPADGPVSVAVVLTVTRWGALEERAAELALEACASLGRDAHVVLVQNGDRDDVAATRAWRPTAGLGSSLRRRYIVNHGFSDACEAGRAAVRPGTRWILFTQADCGWDAVAVRRAVGLSTLLGEAWGSPPAVGPSGGALNPSDPPAVIERGANAGSTSGGPFCCDWLAGYWVLVDADAIDRVGGWDRGYFLYWEDPDLSLRLALGGTRAIAWPDLGVVHARSSTIRDLLTARDRERIRAASRERFAARWCRG